MGRILDYINWRGDLSFKQEPFNQIDAAIFSQLSLLDFDDIVPSSGTGTPLCEVFKLYLKKGYKVEEPLGLFITNKQNLLFEALSQSSRYKDLLLSNYCRIYDETNHCQFEAMTIDLGDELLISFGGTDDTILGWHEDFELLYLDEIPSHKHGLTYLKSIYESNVKNIYMCGHSKGANVAMEVLLSTSNKIYKRVKKVYCFDGPGLRESEYDLDVVKERIGKVISYIPYKVSIGKLFDHYEEYKIVESTANIAYQHDILTWHVIRNDFIYKDSVSADSVYIDLHLKKMIKDMPLKQRKGFVEALFNLLYSTGAKTLLDLYKENKNKLLNNIVKLSKEDRNILNDVLFKNILNDPKLAKIIFDFVREFNNKD